MMHNQILPTATDGATTAIPLQNPFPFQQPAFVLQLFFIRILNYLYFYQL